MVRRVAVTVLILFSTACATRVDKISYFEMPPRLEYRGFSIRRPSNPNWYLLRSDQFRKRALLKYDLSNPNNTHTFFAGVEFLRLKGQPTSHEEFSELAAPVPQKARYEIREESRRTELTEKQGQWCIRYETTDLVRGAPAAPDRELVTVVRGFRCLHPAFPKKALSFFYSERGLREEIDHDLWDEGESFLRSVRIDLKRGTPVY